MTTTLTINSTDTYNTTKILSSKVIYPGNTERLLTDSQKNSYVTLTSCLLEHILTTDDLTDRERFFYLLADSLASIKNKSVKDRSVALSAYQWMTRLGCAKTSIFAMQKALAKKGYFSVVRDRDKAGRDKRNIIVPTLPDLIFNQLLASSYNITKNPKTFNPNTETKRGYLDRTRFFVKINYHLLQSIIANKTINQFQKILWLDLFSKCYILGKHCQARKTTSPGFTTSYQELSVRHDCNQAHISQTIAGLRKSGFIRTEQFCIQSGPAINDRCDKSLWRMTPTLPEGLAHLLPKYGYEVSDISNDDDDDSFDNHLKNEEFLIPCPQELNPLLIKDLKINKNRSAYSEDFLNSDPSSDDEIVKSNFKKNDLEEAKGTANSEPTSSETENRKPTENKKPINFFGKAKELKEFYPLNEDDHYEIQKSAGRKFDLNAANEIFRSMVTRLKNNFKDKFFKSKKAFMSYMAKVFANELRSEGRVNNVTFKTAPRGSEEERVSRREQYLTKVECSLEVGPGHHFKKRLASVLAPDKSYELLKALRRVRVEAGVCILELTRGVELTASEREIILANAKSTHNGAVDADGEKIFVSSLEVFIPKKSNSRTVADTGANPGASTGTVPSEYVPVFEDNIWGRIRDALIRMHGPIGGMNLDKVWFSRLTATIDEERITLKAPSSFVKNWVLEKYFDEIEALAAQVGLAVGLIHGDEKPYYNKVHSPE